MSEPAWISREECIGFHNALLSRFGGPGGIREENMLESALHRAKQLYSYGSPDIFELAAAYAFGIVKNHPFIDGNKRTALMCAALFLETNGYQFTALEEQAVLNTLGLAASDVTPEQYADWLRSNSSERNP